MARLFHGHAKSASELLGVPSGIGNIDHDRCVVEVPVFEEFCAAALARYAGTDQGIERALMVGFIATALVLLQRAGHPVPGSVAPEQQAAWAALRDQHSAVMPR